LAPLISIIVAMHDAERHIAGAIESCLAQSLEDWELVIVDDASADRSVSIARSVSDPRIRVIEQDVNRGPGVARNVGLAAAAGDWLTVLDADDTFDRDRLACLLGLAEELGPGCIYVDRWRRVDDRDVPLGPTPCVGLASGDVEELTLQTWFSRGRQGQPLFHNTALIGLRDPYPPLRVGEDTVFFARLVRAHHLRIFCTSHEHYFYRAVAQSLSHRGRSHLLEREKSFTLVMEEASDLDDVSFLAREELALARYSLWLLDLENEWRTRRRTAALRRIVSSPRMAARAGSGALRRLRRSVTG
jgi:glycosyltransferase involved in cell wall biosynthesis